jgi:hypothetical protein
MADLFALIPLADDIAAAGVTYERVKAVLTPYAKKVSVAAGPSSGSINLTPPLDCVAIFMPELKPLIPDIVNAFDTIEKVQAALSGG